MAEWAAARGFLATYAAAFETFDAQAIAKLFAYPCQVTGDGAEVTMMTVPTVEAWVPQLERLIGAYRLIGVRSAEILELYTTALTPRLGQAIVRWGLVDSAGARLYDFDASYTLADLGQGARIVAIAHNETSRLQRAVVERQRRT